MIDYAPRREACFKERSVDDYQRVGPCMLGTNDPDAPVTFILWGDSHAAALRPGLDEAAEIRGVRGAFFGSPGCPPLLGHQEETHTDHCLRVRELAVDYVNRNNVPNVILAGRWAKAIARADPEMDGNVADVQAGIRLPAAAATLERFGASMEKTIQVISRSPRNAWIVRQAPFMREVLHGSTDFSRLIIKTHIRCQSALKTDPGSACKNDPPFFLCRRDGRSSSR
jgi:hypothetical protein